MSGREIIGIIMAVLGLLSIFVGPFLGYLDIAQITSEIAGKEFNISQIFIFGSTTFSFYVRWFLLLIIGIILRSKMIELIQVMSMRRAIVYIGLLLGLIMLGVLIFGLLREIHVEALIVYVPFIINASILLSWTKDVSKYR
ncbi:hypothetical protein KEJ31_07640 [Candidatus Bathyarchaeota archaeon]|nr:hypothetical protein [Candidatus Bathyarchaeota archaeon]